MEQFNIQRTVETIGISATILIFIGFALWRSLVWAAANVVKPIVDRHMRFLDELSVQLKAQTDVMQSICTRIEHVTSEVDEVRNTIVLRSENVILAPRSTGSSSGSQP